MKRLAWVVTIGALATAAPSGAGTFPEQPGAQYEKRQTGCDSALFHAILGSGGENANPGALANGLRVYQGICLP